jgi:REP element-mobilizing transposase RayT
MPRKARVEVEGGLYHVITRGNNRRRIFTSPGDYEKFLSLLAKQKTKLPFFLYAYCLMSNHVHLLMERQADAIGQIMHRLLTGYARYYNRRHQRVGHLLQGRYKAILCQSDRYLSELVRYIHLNPVRAKMLKRPEQYEYSSHRAYLGLAPVGIVDVDPVLRHFGGRRATAREMYRQFVLAGIKQGQREDFYEVEDDRFLGTPEFVDATIHRIGENDRAETGSRGQPRPDREVQMDRLMIAVERVCRISRADFCGSFKNSASVMAKELLILVGLQMGASMKVLSDVLGVSRSALSRRHDAARLKVRGSVRISKLRSEIIEHYSAGKG